MKKYISLFALLLGSSFSFAASPNSVNFVTTLSSPQGIFARMEAYTARKSASTHPVPLLNYCTDKSNYSRISVYHKNTQDDAQFTNLVLGGVQLQSDDVNKWYFAQPVTVQANASIEVGRLIVNTLALNSSVLSDLKVTDTAYVANVTSKVAKVDVIQVSSNVWFPKCSGNNCADVSSAVAEWEIAGATGASVASCPKASGSGNATNCMVVVVK